MGHKEHITEFIAAVRGGRGDLDAWLECNNEAECRAAILGAIEEEREACAKVAEANYRGVYDNHTCAAAIRGRSNVEFSGATRLHRGASAGTKGYASGDNE